MSREVEQHAVLPNRAREEAVGLRVLSPTYETALSSPTAESACASVAACKNNCQDLDDRYRTRQGTSSAILTSQRCHSEAGGRRISLHRCPS